MTDSHTVSYLLDTNVFIEAHQRYYAFDIHPGFWDCLYHLFLSNQVTSIDHVRMELLRGNDTLSDWISETPERFFASSNDQSVVNLYTTIIDWLNNESQYTDQAKFEFANGADGWLVSYALVNRLKLVTEEVYDRNIRKRVPLPNVCRNFDVESLNTFTLLRQLDIQFNWDFAD